MKQKEEKFIEDGKKNCSALSVVLRNEGILGGPHFLKMYYAVEGRDISVDIEQAGIRRVRLTAVSPISMSALWGFYSQLERLLVLLDGRFLIIEKMEFSGENLSEVEYGEYADECRKQRLVYCKTDPAYCYTDHCFLKFEDVITPDLLSRWFALQEQLDIVHQVVLYNIADTGITHDVKCANFIECLEPMTEIINEYKRFFPSLKPGERTTTLKMCIDAVISKYGTDIFAREYSANKERFLQVLVNTRNRIIHIKRNQTKDKFLSDSESILYLVKLCHLYRVVLLSLLGMDYDSYRDAVVSSVKRWENWEGILDNFLAGLNTSQNK